MGALDIVIAVIILAGLWRGFQVGFIRTSIALVGWFIALLAATRLADDVAPYMESVISSPVLQIGAGFLVVILVVLVGMQVFTLMVTTVVKSLKLGFIDQLAGGVLGAAKNLLIVLVLLSMTAPILVQSSLWRGSVLAPELMPYAPFAKEFTAKVLGEAWEQIDMPSDEPDKQPESIENL